MLIKITNREDLDQTLLGSWVCSVCLGLFWQATNIWNFRTFTVYDLLQDVKTAILGPVAQSVASDCRSRGHEFDP